MPGNEDALPADIRVLMDARSSWDPVRDDLSSHLGNAALDLATRFHGGATLFTVAAGIEVADAQHVAVEFVHPVIVGKRALPAVCLANDTLALSGAARDDSSTGVFARHLSLVARSNDIALALATRDEDGAVAEALETARGMGLCTVALLGTGGGPIARAATHAFVAGSADALIAREAHVAMYHLLWELTHLFLEHPTVLGPGEVR